MFDYLLSVKVKHPSVFLSCWRRPRLPRRRVSHVSLSDVTYFSHRRVSAEPLQRADQLIGGRRRRQLRSRHAVSSGRAEDRPADPGRPAHAQRPRHGAGRPRHRGHVQDGQAVTLPSSKHYQKEREKNTLTCERRGTKGRTNPIPCCMVFQLSDLVLDSVKPFERMRHQNGGKKRRPGNGLAVTPRSVAQRFLLACCVYSVPSHATYIPPKNAHFTFSFLLIYTFFFSLINRRS